MIEKLQNIIPKIALIGQCYIDYVNQPYLITKEGAEEAYLRYVKDMEPVGLMFMEEEQEALQKLAEDTTISSEFYYYWNDAVNTISNSSKLLLMFSAIEALVRKPNGKKDFEKQERILGRELVEKIFTPITGLRHRLVHGEYFMLWDHEANYLEEIHKKIIHYFNSEILRKELLRLDIVNPQRHFFGNKEEQHLFIKVREASDKNLELKSVMDDFTANGPYHSPNYRPVWRADLNSF